MSRAKEIERLNEFEINSNLVGKGSWHDQYKDSPHIFVGGLPYELSEGDIITVFEQYGAVEKIHLARDKGTGKSRGFAFIQYQNQQSTILAVDNLNGIKILGRVIKVDHVLKFNEKPSEEQEEKDSVARKEATIADMADEIFRSAVGHISNNNKGSDGETKSKTVVQDPEELERLERRRLKQLRRERETSEERRMRKARGGK